MFHAVKFPVVLARTPADAHLRMHTCGCTLIAATHRPETDAALLADAITAKIDRDGFTQLCCTGLTEAPKALLAMAEAREWLKLYRVKDFAVAVEVEGAGGGGRGAGREGVGGGAWPLTFTLLECKWNAMTYFKY